jgi:hypothetical protein
LVKLPGFFSLDNNEKGLKSPQKNTTTIQTNKTKDTTTKKKTFRITLGPSFTACKIRETKKNLISGGEI